MSSPDEPHLDTHGTGDHHHDHGPVEPADTHHSKFVPEQPHITPVNPVNPLEQPITPIHFEQPPIDNMLNGLPGPEVLNQPIPGMELNMDTSAGEAAAKKVGQDVEAASTKAAETLSRGKRYQNFLKTNKKTGIAIAAASIGLGTLMTLDGIRKLGASRATEANSEIAPPSSGKAALEILIGLGLVAGGGYSTHLIRN